MDGLIASPIDVYTEHELGVVEEVIMEAFGNLTEKDRRLYFRKLRAANYDAGCLHI